MRPFMRFSSLAVIATSLIVVSGSAQKTTGPKAQYAMDVSTMSGMGMDAMMGDGLGALLGGGGQANYMLDLRLSSAAPSPLRPEKGDHFFLPAAKLGKSVPLLGDAPGKAQPEERGYNPAGQIEKPKGRLLMFWGCHVKAPKGQPFILEFAKLPTANMPSYMPAQMQSYQAAAAARDNNAAWWPTRRAASSRNQVRHFAATTVLRALSPPKSNSRSPMTIWPRSMSILLNRAAASCLVGTQFQPRPAIPRLPWAEWNARGRVATW